jgi:hypothetical protein
MPRESADEFSRKLAKAFAEVKAAGMKRSAYDNWAYRGLRRLGVRIKPPVYCHMGWLALGLGVCFAMSWGICMHFLVWRDNLVMGVQIGISLIAGIMFGAMMALVARFTRHRYKLTPWDQL